ncbi:hypothetical protein RRG08_059772 [Elysia crispata]|uniref:Histone acetyltransferase n=1 Tax=Elysia crispata TaxID=231223 RepID=A0AAE1BE95_9GAST|nr:hypothetical protein RRG08_059772 [Elysia crispata]
MTSPSKHTEWILETIDHLRRRKARPDLARICHVVRRRFGLSPADTEAKLEKLVDAEVVIKVDYKGNVSYRNAAKWRKSMLGCGVLNSTSISTKILEAILEISKATDSIVAAHAKTETESSNISGNIVDSSSTSIDKHDNGGDDSSTSVSRSQNSAKSAAEIGVPLESINGWLKVNCEGFASLRSPLTVILKREIDAGRVRRLTNGNYVISQTQMAAISAGAIRPLKSVKKSPEVCSTGTSSTAPAAAASGAANTAVKAVTPERPTSGAASSGGQSGPAVIPARRGRPPKHRPALAAGAAPLPYAAGASAASATQLKTAKENEDITNCSLPASPIQISSSSKLKRMLTSTTLPPSNNKNGALHEDSATASAAKESEREGGTETSQGEKVARRGAAPGEVLCDFCKLSSLGNTKGEPEALLQCKDCNAKAHPSCMKYSRLLASRACRAPWQCMDCKTCFVCQDSGNPDQMLFCDGCDRGFHMSCHRPTVSKKPSGIWECCDCRLENIALQRSEFTARAAARPTFSHDSAPPTPAESPVPTSHMTADLPTSPTYLGEGRYPDASGWSVEEVAQFLTSAGFTQQAQLFKEQEIDGVSLLLLKRSDVLKGLDMKLGPALKVNRLVQGLQTARQGIL